MKAPFVRALRNKTPLRWFAISACALCCACSGGGVLRAQPANIIVTIVEPEAGTFVGESLKVIAAVSSTFEVKKVVARVEGQETVLGYSPTAYYGHGGVPQPGWTNTLSLAGLTRGAKTLTVEVTDVLDNSAQSQQAIVYDRRPVVTISVPLPWTVARPQVRIVVDCTDDDPVGCSLTVDAEGVPLATGHDHIDQVVSLASFEGKMTKLRITAIDSAGQNAPEVLIPVYVDSSTRLGAEEEVAGVIWDVQPDRILHLQTMDDRGVLKIRQRSSGQDSVVMDQAGQFPQSGYLTPEGAIFVEQTGQQSGDVLTQELYEKRGDDPAELLSTNSIGEYLRAESLVVKGAYAIWNRAGSLFLRDLAAKTNTVVAAGDSVGDVAANGDVVYYRWTTYPIENIFRYRAGEVTQLTADTILSNRQPLTDGNGVVYQKFYEEGLPQRWGLMLITDAGGEIVLAPLEDGAWYGTPGTDYQINNGWVAFRRLGSGGQSQVWTRSPDGTLRQITFFSDSSGINALAPNGEIMFLHGGRRYLSRPGQESIEVSSALATRPVPPWAPLSFWQDGQWWVSIGRSLFQVLTDNQPPTLATIANQTVDEGATLSVSTSATDPEGGPVTFQLNQAPAGATINGSGVVSWTPMEAQGPGTYQITVQVTDDGSPGLTATGSFTVTVNEVNSAPLLAEIGNRTNFIGRMVTFTAAAADPDLPANTLSFGLAGAPAGASIDASSGLFTWTIPGPNNSTNKITLVVSDNGSPVMSTSETITIVGLVPPPATVVTQPQSQQVGEGGTAQFSVEATGEGTLTYQWLHDGNPIAGATNSTLVITNVRSSDAGTYSVIIHNGSITTSVGGVLTVNQPPTLAVIPNQTVDEGATLSLSTSAIDPEGGPLTYRLTQAPAGATINDSGVVSWTPTEAQGPGTNQITVQVTDDGSPGLTATGSFTVTVNEVNSAPVLAEIGNRTNFIGRTVSFTAAATDPDLPTNTLSFSLAGAPAGASIDASSGLFSWTIPGPDNSINKITLLVSDNGSPPISAAQTFTIVGKAAPSPTVLDIQLTGGQALITFGGIPGETYWVQSTTNLHTPTVWSMAATNVASQTGSFQHVDSQAKEVPMRFFRAALP